MTGSAEWLKGRADSYSRDARILRADGDGPMAVAYQTIADELRKCAAESGEWPVGDRLRVYLDSSNCIMVEQAYHHPQRLERFTVTNAAALIEGLEAARTAQTEAS